MYIIVNTGKKENKKCSQYISSYFRIFIHLFLVQKRWKININFKIQQQLTVIIIINVHASTSVTNSSNRIFIGPASPTSATTNFMSNENKNIIFIMSKMANTISCLWLRRLNNFAVGFYFLFSNKFTTKDEVWKK